VEDRRGRGVPSFYSLDLKQKVEDLIAECTAGTNIFPVKISVSVSNEISLLLDSDSGLTLADCKMVSRHIESNFDREEEDFSLTVASSGLGEPLSVNRQYLKNVGRKVKVKLLEGEILEGLMISADDQEIMIEWKSREKKPLGKGKVTVVNKRTIAFSDIKETIVLITF
jgi:ribosome maturation factor RimP